jgi:hypothetical protein
LPISIILRLIPLEIQKKSIKLKPPRAQSGDMHDYMSIQGMSEAQSRDMHVNSGGEGHSLDSGDMHLSSGGGRAQSKFMHISSRLLRILGSYHVHILRG